MLSREIRKQEHAKAKDIFLENLKIILDEKGLGNQKYVSLAFEANDFFNKEIFTAGNFRE